MTTRSLILLLSVLAASGMRAQLLAGEVPDGATALDMNIDLSLSTSFTMDSTGLEIDCDDFWDITAILVRGEPAIDAPNVAMLRLIDDDIEILASGTAYSDRPQYFDQDDSIVPAVGFDWYADDVISLGDFGGFTATGPVEMDHTYIAVRRNGQVAWIQLSFLLNNSLSVSLQVHSALSFCGLTTGVPEEVGPGFRLVPSFSSGEPVRLEPDVRIRTYEVIDASGRPLASYGGTARMLAVPQAPGTYTVRAVHGDGRISVARLVRF